MALALYRKYRPATFAEVVGQEHVTGPLMTAVDSGRINHAYLFSGPRGCGKTSSARILARSLNCAEGPTSTPCGVCQSCIGLAPDGSGDIDVIEIDAASHGGVDDARELRERAFQLPVQNRYKIYIIDEAHMVSNQGFNALLKVVEEPPESVVFIFATTEPDKVLPTIRSRTHHYPFRLVPPAAMRDLLERNCVSEGVQVGPAVLPLVVRAGGGSVRDSQSLLDQLIAGAGPDGVTYEEALALLGVTDSALLDDLVEAIGVADGATVFGTVNRLIDAGHDPRRFGADLLDRLRDLILMAAVPDAGEKGLIDAPVDYIERLADQANRLGLSTLSRLADIVHVGLTEMRGTTAPRLGLELICARMLLPAVGDDGASMTQRIERLERRMEIGGLPAGEGARRAPAGDGGPDAARRPRSTDGMTPRQRAEADLGARPGSRPDPQQTTESVGANPPIASGRTPDAAPPAFGKPAPVAEPSTTAVSTPDTSPSVSEPVRTAPAVSSVPEHSAPEGSTTAHASDTAAGPRDGLARAQVGESPTAAEPAAPARSANPPSSPAVPPAVSKPSMRESSVPESSVPESSISEPSVSEPTSVPDSGWPEVKAPGSGRSAAATPTPTASVPVERSAPVQPATTSAAPSTHVAPGALQAAEPAPVAAAAEAQRPATAPGQPESVAKQEIGSDGQPPAGSTLFDIAEVRRQWRSVVDSIKRSSRATAALVETATPVVVRGDTLVLTAPPALVRRLSDPQQHQPLKAALQEVLGVSWSIEISDPAPDARATESSGPGASNGASSHDDDEDFASHPDDESVADPRAGLDPGQAAVNLLRDELGAEEISEQ